MYVINDLLCSDDGKTSTYYILTKTQSEELLNYIVEAKLAQQRTSLQYRGVNHCFVLHMEGTRQIITNQTTTWYYTTCRSKKYSMLLKELTYYRSGIEVVIFSEWEQVGSMPTLPEMWLTCLSVECAIVTTRKRKRVLGPNQFSATNWKVVVKWTL